MRKINRTTKFKRDYKRELKGRYRSTLNNDFINVVKSLADDIVLDGSYHDHSLTCNWNDHRECHIKPDLLLIYRKPNDESLDLVRLGSHSKLGL